MYSISIPFAARTALLGAAVFLVSTTIKAQQGHNFDLGVQFVYDRTQVTPVTQSLSGGQVLALYGLTPHFAAIVEVAVVQNQSIRPLFYYVKPYYSLDQLTYAGGVRYSVTSSTGRLRPFAEALAGGARAFGDLAAANTLGQSSNALIFQTGAGLDVQLTDRLAITPFTIDYLLTTFNDSHTNYQNQFRLSAGVTFRLRRGGR